MPTERPEGRQPRVVTILLNYRHADDTVRCVQSLRESDFADQQILVVDNAPEGPNTASLRTKLAPDVEVIATGDNLGYAGGNNVGIARALQSEPQFVWLVNPDTVANRTTLSGLVRAAEANPDAGIVGCRMLRGDSRPARIESNGGSIDPERWGVAPKLDAGRFDREVLDTGVRDVDWVSGACLLLRPALLDDVGLLPEDYFLYFEDTEFCLRARQAGWRVIVAQDTRMWHFRRSSNDQLAASYIYYLYRSRIHFGVRLFNATVDDVVADFDQTVQRWRSRIRRDNPELLDPFEELLKLAVDHARAGRMGRASEIEAIPFSPNPVSDRGDADRLLETLQREHDQAVRDAKRLLARIKSEVEETDKLEQALDRERQRRRRLEAELSRLRTSRSFRLARALRRLGRPVTSTLARIPGRSNRAERGDR